MKRELLNIEGGKIKKGNNVIFDDLSLELFQGEITGIVFDDILEQKLFIEYAAWRCFYFIHERFL